MSEDNVNDDAEDFVGPEDDEPDFDAVSDDEIGGRIFEPGSEILIQHGEGGLSVGAYIGLTEFGVIYRATYRMKMVQEQVDPEIVNGIRSGLMLNTVAELRVMAEEEELSLAGLKKKSEIIEELTDYIVAQVNKNMEPHEELVMLKRSVLTFLPWHEVGQIERAEEYLEEKELERFSQSLDAFKGIPEDEATVPPSEAGKSDV